MVHGTGFAFNDRLRRRGPGQHPARHPRPVPGRLARRGRERLDRRHPVGRTPQPWHRPGTPPWRRAYGQRLRGRAGGQGPQHRAHADHQHPAAAALGPRARDLQRGPVPDRRSKRPRRSAACKASTSSPPTKHFVANNQEVLRSSHQRGRGPAHACSEIYEPAFKMAVQQGGVGAIMCSYNRVNGTYACENAES